MCVSFSIFEAIIPFKCIFSYPQHLSLHHTITHLFSLPLAPHAVLASSFWISTFHSFCWGINLFLIFSHAGLLLSLPAVIS